MLIVMNLVPILKVISYGDKIPQYQSKYAIGAKQLARILYTAKNINLGNELTFKNERDEVFKISLNHQRVVKEPGFDIIIHGVRTLDFYRQDKNVYMLLNDGIRDYHYLIAVDYENDEPKIPV